VIQELCNVQQGLVRCCVLSAEQLVLSAECRALCAVRPSIGLMAKKTTRVSTMHAVCLVAYCLYINLWEQKVRQKKFWPLGIPELQLAVDPLGWQFEKKFV